MKSTSILSGLSGLFEIVGLNDLISKAFTPDFSSCSLSWILFADATKSGQFVLTLTLDSVEQGSREVSLNPVVKR